MIKDTGVMTFRPGRWKATIAESLRRREYKDRTALIHAALSALFEGPGIPPRQLRKLEALAMAHEMTVPDTVDRLLELYAEHFERPPNR